MLLPQTLELTRMDYARGQSYSMAGDHTGWRMEGSGSGYITDIAYSDGFYIFQTPQHLGLTATINAIESTDLTRGFSYCELGCGTGLTSIILAAVNPTAEFHAVDFNPAHIAHGRALSSAADISNINWHNIDFAELGPRSGELPMFDIITMHGVWSWIAPELQDSIVRFVERHLRPGGLLYVSYNAMPAWSQIAPLQRLLKELAAVMPGPSDRKVQGAVEMIMRLHAAKMIPDRYGPGVKLLTKLLQGRKLTYLAHEYLNSHWKPVYQADVARALAPAKLEYVGPASLMRTFEQFLLTGEQDALLDEVADPQIREFLKDFHLQHSFNEDVYVREGRRMSEQRRAEILEDTSLCLFRPAPDKVELHGPNDLMWVPHPEAFNVWFGMLGKGPRTVAELMKAPGIPPELNDDPAAVACLLVGGGFAAPIREPPTAAVVACDRFNRMIADKGKIPLNDRAVVASASLGIGITLSPGELPLYAALLRGERPDPDLLARQLGERARAEGASPIMAGKTVDDPVEAIAALAKDYVTKIDHLVPIWRQIGIF